LVVLAAGYVTFLAFDSRAAEMVRDTMGDLDLHAKKFVTSAFSSLEPMQLGIILMVVAIAVAAIFFREGDEDKI
jgi:hypothetical protein